MSFHKRFFKKIKCKKGQATVETMLMGLPFLLIVGFGMIQLSMIFVGWYRANESAFQGVRVAMAHPRKSASACLSAAESAIDFVLFPGIGVRKDKVTIYQEDLEKRNEGGGNVFVRWFSVHLYYSQGIITSSFIGSFLNIIRPFRAGGGQVSSVTHARMVKPYHTDYYIKGYKGANAW